MKKLALRVSETDSEGAVAAHGMPQQADAVRVQRKLAQHQFRQFLERIWAKDQQAV